jgi:hypothetical protein
MADCVNYTCGRNLPKLLPKLKVHKSENGRKYFVILAEFVIPARIIKYFRPFSTYGRILRTTFMSHMGYLAMSIIYYNNYT